jgi:CRP/FNR family nitrogen fixation transcriptional regulator
MQPTMQLVDQISGGTSQRSSVPAAPPDALDVLEQFGTTIRVKREQEIHPQGEGVHFCYRVLRGCIRTVGLMEDGRRQVGEFLMAGDLLGFDALETYDFAAEAVSDTVLRRYPRRMVDALAERSVFLTRRLRDLTSISLRTANARLVLLGRKTASERLANFLLEMSERLPGESPDVLELPMSRTDIADHLGLTIETVCRVLAHLRHNGTVAIDRTSITVRDRSALQAMASGSRH